MKTDQDRFRYVSRKLLDQYFDRFGIKLVRSNERLARFISEIQDEMKTINDTLSYLTEASNEHELELDKLRALQIKSSKK